MITHELLHLAWWNFAQTCTLTTSRSLLNTRVIGQKVKVTWIFVCFFCVHDTVRTSWLGFAKCCTGVARGQYLALSKGYLFAFCRNYTNSLRMFCSVKSRVGENRILIDWLWTTSVNMTLSVWQTVSRRYEELVAKADAHQPRPLFH